MKRDPQRIYYIMHALTRIWESNPDLRLGQMLNFASSLVDENITQIEDLKLLNAVQKANTSAPEMEHF